MARARAADFSSGLLPVRISLFGQPRAGAADGSRDFPLPRKTLNVMAYLILHCRRPATRESIASALFPDDDGETARGYLRQNLSYLLSSLPPAPPDASFVHSDFERISWNANAPAEVDVFAFDRAVAEGRDDDAIAFYAGELLPTLYDDWTIRERERLRDAFHEALARTIQRDRSLRRFDRAAATAHRLLDEDPWREDIVRQLMAIRYEAGDRAGALAAFERFAERLQAEMKAEPMAETFAVRDAVLRGARLASSEPADRRLSADATLPMTLPFVGRSAAMEVGLDLWHTAANGRASVLFAAGQAGIGKSRLAVELARAIEREGGIVLRGETAAGGEHRPYEAFVEALKSAAPIRARTAAGGEEDVWQRVLDELLDDHARATFVDDRAARVRLFDSVRRGLSDLARARPVAVILEDLHWAGAATIDLLEYVATRLGKTQVLIVATFRNDELSRAHPLRALRRQLQGHGNAIELALEPLGADDATAAARGAAPHVDDDMLAQAVKRAAGVPLLLSEALRDIAAGHEIGDGAIEEVFGSRLARLSSAAETALVYGAVLGARFDLTALAAATGWNDGELVDALGESIELGLIRASTRPPGLAFTFTHHLVHDIALKRLTPHDREVAHALVARALASLPQSHSTRSSEIARHFQAAGDSWLAAQYFLDAARYALDVFANNEACESATVGLSLIDELGEAQARLRYDLLDVRERAFARMGALEERRADALALFGHSAGDSDLACATLERVFEAHRDNARVRRETLARLEALAPASDRNAAIFERALSANAFMEADYPAARDAALRAAGRFERLGDSRAAFFARSQYITTLYRLGDLKSVGERIAELRPTCESSDDVELRMEFHRIASSVLTAQHPLETGLSDARQSIELALRVGDRFAEARARQNAATYLGRMNEYEQALCEHEKTLEAYRDVGDAGGVVNAILNLASVRGFCGDHEGAEALLDQVPGEALERPWIALVVAINRAAFAMRSDRIHEAEPHLITARALASRLETALYAARIASCYGEFCARSGRNGEARMHFDEALESSALLAQPALVMETHALFARFCAGAGDFDAAREHAAEAAALAKDFPIQHFAEYAWHLAAAYALLGEEDDARRFAELAARAFVDEALHMDADLAEAYSRLPWHIHAIAYLNGRTVPLRLSDSE